MRRVARSWQAFAVVLVVWGNAAAYLAGTAISVGWTGPLIGTALVVISLAWARGQGLTLDELGLGTSGLGRGAVVGLAFALVSVAGALLVLRYPPLLGEAVSYTPLAAADAAGLALRVAVTMPLDTIAPEEVAFRAVLLGALLRRYGATGAVVLSALAFAAWHAVIVSTTVAQTNLTVAGLFTVLGMAGAFLAVFAGGIAFAALRVRTRSLAAPLLAHWAFNGALLSGLRLLG